MTVRRVPIAGQTRENFTVNERSTGRQHRFVLPGPQLSVEEQIQCLTQLQWASVAADYVVASGSLPCGVAPNFYQRVADLCCRARHLRHRHRPPVLGGGLLKTSAEELGARASRQLPTQSERVDAARQLIDDGVAETVLVTMGRVGAVLVTAAAAHYQPALTSTANGGVGAGDGMLAAVTVGLARCLPLERAVQLGAAAAAVLLTPGTAMCQSSAIYHLLTHMPDPVGATDDPDVYAFVRSYIPAPQSAALG